MSMMAVMKIVLLAAGTGRMGMAPACYRRGRKSAIRMGILRGYGNIGPALLYIPAGHKGTARPTPRNARINKGVRRWPKEPHPRPIGRTYWRGRNMTAAERQGGGRK